MTARILVADDEPVLLEMLGELLSIAGYEARGVQRGEEALALIQAGWPDLLILDVNMPELDGFSVLRALRDQPPARRPKILVLTARYAQGDAERARILGADGFVSKPFSNRDLLARIRSLLDA
jgi:DNA-binding response OmpR family regulator